MRDYLCSTVRIPILSVLCRRNWRQRFFVLYPNKRLCYYEKDTIDEASKPSGVIEMANVT